MSKKKYFLLAALLFFIYLINGIAIIPLISVNPDESDHWYDAVRFIKGQPQKQELDDASTMPVSVFNTVPRVIQQLTGANTPKNDWGISDIKNGRYVTLFLCLLTGFFVLKWATELYGKASALLALFFYTFCPNLNAHNTLLTTDAYSALFAISTAYFFWKSLINGGFRNLLFFSVSFGMAQLAKQSLTHFYFIFPLLTLIYYLKHQPVNFPIRKNLLRLMFVVSMVLLVINIGFQFYRTGTSLRRYDFQSKTFRYLQEHAGFFKTLPMPLPYPYLQGLDLTKHIDELGPGRPENSGAVYILGQRKKSGGFWYYYFILLLFKVPIPILLASGLSFYFILKKKGAYNFWQNEFVPAIIILYFLIYFSFFYNSQVGIRHIIMILPLLYVILGSLATIEIYKSDRFKKKVLAFFGIYLLASFYYYFPNLLSYTNELVLPKRFAYKKIADISYYHGKYFMEDYLRFHPNVKYIEEKPQTGFFLISINDYLDLSEEQTYDWIKKFEPITHVNHVYLLFHITETDIEKLH